MYNRRITDIEINTKNAMKKIVLTLILAWLTWTGTAQGFVRIDTVYTPYFDFDYESWIADSTHPLLTVQGSLVLPPPSRTHHPSGCLWRQDGVQLH